MASSAHEQRFLTFRLDRQLYALPTGQVAEVIRIPVMARVPQSHRALLGLGNLRGVVLPMVGLRELLSKGSTTASAARAIVLDIGMPVALVVDSVAALETAGTGRAEAGLQPVGADDRELLLGAFTSADREVAEILDIRPLLQAAFASVTASKARTLNTFTTVSAHPAEAGRVGTGELLLTFEVGGQEFALPLDTVQEIVPAPRSPTAMVHADPVVIGMTAVRDTLMPLLSLRGLLGFSPNSAFSEHEKIIVMKLGAAQVGLVADQARSVLTADSTLIDPVPPVLAARTGGEARIRAVYRGEGGRRLVSILSPEQMFREDVMQKLTAHGVSAQVPVVETKQRGAELAFLVFRLGDAEFGLPIEAVVEVAPVPEQIARVPKAPKFLEGLINLRGEVLPVVDQRRRFDMPTLERREACRLVVVKTERHLAGIIVDSVSEVLRTDAQNLAPPPELTDEPSARLVHGVINLESAGRIVLLLDPTELLTRTEQGLLDKFVKQNKKDDA